jgi:5'(3')-deoxyribonucleotidase
MKILLDMDGVLADFVGEVEEIFNFPLAGKINEHDDFWSVLGQSPNDFWNHKDINKTEFWENLAKYSWADELVSILHYYAKEVHICSSPSLAVPAFSGKAKWIENHYPTLLGNIVLTRNKSLLANEDHILIDDSEVMVNNFRKAGGNAILFPQEWNANKEFINDRIGYVSLELEKLMDFDI